MEALNRIVNLFKHKNMFEKLRGQLQDLGDAKETVQLSVDEATRNDNDLHAEMRLEDKYKKRFLVSRYQFNKKAGEEANGIAQLLKEKDQFDGGAVDESNALPNIVENEWNMNDRNPAMESELHEEKQEGSDNNQTPGLQEILQQHHFSSSSSNTGMGQSMEPSTDLQSEWSKLGEDNQTVELQFSPSLLQQPHDDNLKKHVSSLRIERYGSSMIPKEILERSSLQELYIIDCVHLKIFPLSPSLKILYIKNCKILELFIKINQVPQLEHFCLGSSCDSVRSFPLNYFRKLKCLTIWDCRNLEKFSMIEDLPKESESLVELHIKDCRKFKSFGEEFNAPKLKSLAFFNCESLESLQWIHRSKSLWSLALSKCPALSFPSEGLPSSLRVLSISFCDLIIPGKEWKLDGLDCLRCFEIEGGCLKSFPEVGLLPTSLTKLRISNFSNLISLDREGLQYLSSLRVLEINRCNKLDSLPELGLPSSLYSLTITNCPLLNSKLQNKKGEEWSKIAHIPSIHLGEKSH